MTPPVHTTTRRVRYSEADTTGVVFNAHYLTYCDDAFEEYLEALGVDYPSLQASGYDMLLVNADISWSSPLRPRDIATVSITCERVGTTSFTCRFDMKVGDRAVATARLTYAGIKTSDFRKTEVPDRLRKALLGLSED